MAYIREEMRVASAINLLIGIWLVLAPFFVWFTEVEPAMWNSILIGGALILLCLAEIVRPFFFRNLSWINFVLGLWLFFSPLIFGYMESLAPTLIHLGMGMMVAAISIGSIIASRTAKV